MNLRQRLLTMVMITLLARPATAWQPPPGVRPDPYAQPPVTAGNTGFRFGPDPNAQPPAQPAPQPPPQFAPPIAQPQPQPQPQPQGPVAQPPIIPGFNPAANPAADNQQAGSALFQPSQIVATVGNQYILYGDVAPTVNQMLEPAFKKARSDEERSQIEAVRSQLTQQVVRQMVETKILYLEFDRELEKNAGRDKVKEARADITKRVRDGFEKQLLVTREKVVAATTPEEVQELAKRDPILPRLAILMKDNNIETLADLDQVLRRYGSSLAKQQQAFADHNLGRSKLSDKIKTKSEVSHLEMLNYYREHADDFAVKAKSRFEMLSVKFVNYPNRDAAWQALAQMGNEVFLGTPFAAVAKKGSQDPNADKGGLYDWTTEKSLASDVLNNAIFTFDPGKLSPILEDERGLHIIRVIERTPAGFIPFTDAQVKIKELINQQRREVAYKAYLASLRSKTVVWTIYDADPANNVAAKPGANPQR